MYSVTSSFIYNAAQHAATPSRQLLIGTSDYSSYVLRWPSIKKSWDGVLPQTVTINLSNEDKTFNFYTADPTKMQNKVYIKLGFGSEYIVPFAGTVDALRFTGGGVDMTLIDKFKKLSDRTIGDTSSPVLYTSSSYLVHNLAWYICTSHGGLSATVSSANTDIDYPSWNSWSSVFSADNVRMQARFTGQKPLEALHQIAILTQSAIFIENDKVKFMRFTLADSAHYTMNNDTVFDSTATLDDRDLINKALVNANYNVASDSFSILVNKVSSGSISTYGVREQLIDNNLIWLVDSASALNLAQRIVSTKQYVTNKYQAKSGLHAVMTTIGDSIVFQDTQLDVSDNFRVMGESLNIDDATKIFELDQSQFFNSFILDVTSLDGSEVLT